MTKGAQKEWTEFKTWCEEKNLKSVYNTKDDLEKLRKHYEIELI